MACPIIFFCIVFFCLFRLMPATTDINHGKDIIAKLAVVKTKLQTASTELNQALSNMEILQLELTGSERVPEKVFNSTSHPFVHLLEARRFHDVTGLTYVLNYKMVAGDLSIMWSSGQTTDVDTVVPGVKETSCTLQPTGQPLTVVFISMSFGASLYIELEPPAGNSTVIESNIPTLDLFVQPDRDLVYKKGSNITFKTNKFVQFPDYFDITGDFIDFETGDFWEKTDQKLRTIFERLEPKNVTTPGEDLEEIKLKTANHRISGLIHFYRGKQLQSSLISFIMLKKSLVVRPAGQEGPFPQGFLHLVMQTGNKKQEFGQTVAYCSFPSCVVACEAFGDNITDVTVKQLSRPTLGGQSGFSRVIRYSETRYNQGHSVQLTNFSQGDQYVCDGSNVNGGHVSLTFVIKTIRRLAIIKENSTVSRTCSSEDMQDCTYHVTCVVEGRPQPRISVEILRENWNTSSLSREEISYLGNDVYQLSGEASLDGTDGLSTSVLCTTDVQDESGEHQFDAFYIPSPPI
ncbi:uncharacterized protein LOC131951629 isoform X2 [Physella acuta]|uniref:uncharacterized protein LOC131951629 isoform X2 n=1 Tax=Physella acuta TaxID=109671 RepID=UPI0027DE6898|nr:uncharacterized protein LOC131951629 isoform X2 [Physella acuta]